jgi:molecular chaperone DnaJ
VHVVVDTPTDLDDEQRRLLVAFAEARDELLEGPPAGDGLFSKLRSALS